MATVLSGAQVSPSGQQGPVGTSFAKAVVGDTSQGTNPSDAIIVPSYASHPDQIFKGTLSAMDDHFEGSTLDPKWTKYISAGQNNASQNAIVAGSMMSFGTYSPVSNDGVSYFHYYTTPTPNTNSFTITVRLDILLLCQSNATAQCYAGIWLSNPVGGGDIRFFVYNAYASVPQIAYSAMILHVGPSSTGVNHNFLTSLPKYMRFIWDSSALDVECQYSLDGRSFQYYYNQGSAPTGFTTTYKPTQFGLLSYSKNRAQTLMSVDWVKFTNP